MPTLATPASRFSKKNDAEAFINLHVDCEMSSHSSRDMEPVSPVGWLVGLSLETTHLKASTAD